LVVWNTLRSLFYRLMSRISSEKSVPINTVRENSLCLQKLPQHIGFIVVEDDISIRDLVKLMIWSAASGITYISIYDKFGFIKGNKTLVEEELSVELGETEKKRYSFTVYEGCVRKLNPQVNNGVRHIDVHLLTASDGREKLVNLAKKFSAEVMNKKCTVHEITPSSVDSILHGEQGFPDPDMVVRFGQIESLLGYLPWQTRLTEILSLPTHHRISYKSFHQLLLSYGSTEQRFGK